MDISSSYTFRKINLLNQAEKLGKSIELMDKVNPKYLIAKTLMIDIVEYVELVEKLMEQGTVLTYSQSPVKLGSHLKNNIKS